LIDSLTFATFAADCMYRDGMLCTRRAEMPYHAPRVLGNSCEYDACGLLRPCVRPLADGGFAVSLVEESGRTVVVEGPFEQHFQATNALKKYRTRAEGIAAVMARRS